MSSPPSGASTSKAVGHGRLDRTPLISHPADPALPPAVLVTVHDEAPPGVLREVCAGAEEQGIPTAILPGPGGSPTDADDAGRHAAGESRLEVGVGIGPDGAVVVRHALVPDPVLRLDGGAPAARVRQAGADAARIVAGLALRAM